MARAYDRYRWVVVVAQVALVFLLAVVGVGIATTITWGALGLAWPPAPVAVLGLILSLLFQVAMAMVLFVLYGLVTARVTNTVAAVAMRSQLDRLESLLQAQQDSLRRLTDLASLSDAAKTMVYREREIEAVHEMVHECLLRQDYARAEQLIRRMEEQLGARPEVEHFRAEVRQTREAKIDDQVGVAVERVEQIIQQRNWPRALRETEGLQQRFPNHPRVSELPRRIAEARAAHKRELLQGYDEAVKRNDVDRSVVLLRELDRYLTPQEAAALQESARGVFKARLHNLGVQFTIAVNDERWPEAVRIGEQIVGEFPNTRMAAEVGPKLEALRQRAAVATA